MGPGIPDAVNWRAIRTAIIDIIIVALVLLAGIIFHGTNPFAIPGHTVLTLAPFLLGWILVAPIAGAYTTRVRESMGRSVASVSIAWTAAVLLGSGLRASHLFPGEAPISFMVVMIGSGLLGLIPWRIVAIRYGLN